MSLPSSMGYVEEVPRHPKHTELGHLELECWVFAITTILHLPVQVSVPHEVEMGIQIKPRDSYTTHT